LKPWRTAPGTVLIATAASVHVAMALWSIWRRRTLRLKTWEAWQLVLGFLIPMVLAAHIIAARGLHEVHHTNGNYHLEFLALWVFYPVYGVLQAVGLVIVWVHGCLGIHTWLRLKPWYPRAQPLLYALALLLPTVALSGYVAAGVRVVELAGEPAWIGEVVRVTGFRPEMPDTFVFPWEEVTQFSLLGLVVFILLARRVRAAVARLGGERLRYRDIYGARPRDGGRGERAIELMRGATVLEMLRAAGIPHASVCGGRGRCSTCRVRVGLGADSLPAPDANEWSVLDHIQAPPGVRLACQTRPTLSLEVTPLLPAVATAEDGLRPVGNMPGDEREVAVLFADMRDFTRLAESRLPFDVVYVLNRYFAAMGEAVNEAGGRLDKFIGDGVMALFGVEGPGGSGEACKRALDAARLMSTKLVELNRGLASVLPKPLSIGIGIHVGPVIVGDMGYGSARGVTAIGDVVNVASRLEGMTKELGIQLLVSEDVAARSGIDLDGFARREMDVRGRAGTLGVRLVRFASDLPVG
jgi:adenylate cyclase